MSKENWDEAVIKYMETTQLPSGYCYKTAVEHCGLSNIFYDDVAADIIRKTYYELEKLNE